MLKAFADNANAMCSAEGNNLSYDGRHHQGQDVYLLVFGPIFCVEVDVCHSIVVQGIPL